MADRIRHYAHRAVAKYDLADLATQIFRVLSFDPDKFDGNMTAQDPLLAELQTS